MSMTPHQWFDWKQKVNTAYQDFKNNYASDTGSVIAGNTVGTPWLAGDSGIAAPAATEAERLRVLSVAHQPSTMSGNAHASHGNRLLREMGRGSSLNFDGPA